MGMAFTETKELGGLVQQMENKEYFYVEIVNRNKNNLWYNEFLNGIFLVRKDPENHDRYEVAGSQFAIYKEDALRTEVSGWRPM